MDYFYTGNVLRYNNNTAKATIQEKLKMSNQLYY